jgi:hypothetical protein
MDRISAAGNLTIEVKPDSWRLIVNGNSQERVLVEANVGEPLRYIPTFAAKRRLPDTGKLPIENIQRVVLGWSNDDESWHLGLLLTQDLANARGSRWCEIARWPDPDVNVFSDIASQAGRTLARTITRPFNLIDPPPQSDRVSKAIEIPPLRSLPLEFDLWSMDKQQDKLQLTRSPSWSRSRIVRIVWYTILASIYVLLSVTSLSGVIALPAPLIIRVDALAATFPPDGKILEIPSLFLPYLGLITAALLGAFVIYTLYQLITQPDRIIVDENSHSVYAQRGDQERWRLDNVAIDSVYVSEIVSRRGRKRIVHHGEMNLRLQDGTFFYLFDQPQAVDDLFTPAEIPDTEAVLGLTPLSAFTDMQMAGLWMAQALNLPCWYDRRAR